jgi:hypothetical protein
LLVQLGGGGGPSLNHDQKAQITGLATSLHHLYLAWLALPCMRPQHHDDEDRHSGLLALAVIGYVASQKFD